MSNALHYKNVEVLERDEELELILLAKQGDQKAIDKLTLANIPLITLIYNKFKHWSRGDFINSGVEGFLVALKKFDPSKGYRLATFARWWILAYMIYGFAEIEDVSKNLKTRKSVSKKFGQLILHFHDLPSFIEIEDKKVIHIDHHLIARERADVIRSCIQTLDDREQQIILRHVMGDGSCRLQDIANEYGIVRERVRQIELSALEKLRLCLLRKGIKKSN